MLEADYEKARFSTAIRLTRQPRKNRLLAKEVAGDEAAARRSIGIR